MAYNANWQGTDGSMISWISSENNIGATSYTTVMYKQVVYNLGLPILAAAVQGNLVYAIHASGGKAVFNTYNITTGQALKQTSIPLTVTPDSSEIARITALYNNPPRPDTTSISTTAIAPQNTKGNTGALFGGFSALYYQSWLNGLKAGYVHEGYRASISPDLTTILVHLGFKFNVTRQMYLNSPLQPIDLSANPLCGFAIFDTTGTFKNAQYFDTSVMMFFSGCFYSPWDSSYPYGYNSGPFSTSPFSIITNTAMVGHLQSDNILLFAELVGNTPNWLKAKVDHTIDTGYVYLTGVLTESFWKLV